MSPESEKRLHTLLRMLILDVRKIQKILDLKPTTIEEAEFEKMMFDTFMKDKLNINKKIDKKDDLSH